jgi:hypothetical protein
VRALIRFSGPGPGRQSPAAQLFCADATVFFQFQPLAESGAAPFQKRGAGTCRCGEKLREIDGSLRPGDGWKMEVTDAGGKALFALKLTTESSE